MTASYEASSPRELRSPSQDGGGRARMEPRVQSALGRELRAMYDGVVSQPVPDRFTELLDRLEQREKGSADDGTNSEDK